MLLHFLRKNGQKIRALQALSLSQTIIAGLLPILILLLSLLLGISAEFKLYIIKDYKRLKSDESSTLSFGWNLNRKISKLNYRIHTDAIKENLIPLELTPFQISVTYASEAGVLNVVLFGITAKQWREKNPDKNGNIS